MFNPELTENFRRILASISPDIIAFQEIFYHQTYSVLEKVNELLPPNEGEQWYCARVEDLISSDTLTTDLALVSKWPIIDIFAIPGHDSSSKENSAFLVDLPNREKHLLIFNIHPPSGNNIDERTGDLDRIMAFLKDAQSPGGEITIAENSPFIITGDFNLVRYAYQRDIVLFGDIQDNISFGEDFNPDWDGTPLADAKPFTTNTPFVFTWIEDSETFPPGRLDYIVYSDYTLNLENSFTLFSRALPEDTLVYYNLEKEDVILASDHLPVVADFSINSTVNVEKTENEAIKDFKLEQNYPNPFNPSTTIYYSISEPTFVRLALFNSIGQKVKMIIEKFHSAGNYKNEFSSENLPSGIYFYRMEAGDFTETKKMILLR